MTSGQAWQRMQSAINAKLCDASPENIAALRKARDDLTHALEREGPVGKGKRFFERPGKRATAAAFSFLKP